MKRLLATSLIVLLACLVATAPLGQAQERPRDRPPTELWERYPLDETTPKAPAPEDGRASPPARTEADGGASGRDEASSEGGGIGIGVIAAGALALAVLLALLLGRPALRRRRAPAASAEPQPKPKPAAKVPAAQAAGAGAGAAAVATAKASKPAPAAATNDSEADSVDRPKAPRGDKPDTVYATSGPAPKAPAEDALTSAPTRNELALGYTTVSEDEEATSPRLREEAQRIQAACRDRGLTLSKLVRDLESHSGLDLGRPGLSYALDRLAAGEFNCLVVTRLDRLTRSAANLGTLMRMLRERDARLVVIDIELDTRTREGRLAAETLATVGGLERKKLEQRTRKGLEAARSKRRSSGRPAVADRPSLKQRISEMRAAGMTLQAIADTLNDEGVPTVRGGAEWRPSSVQAAAGYKRPNRRGGPRSREKSSGS